MIGLVDWDLQTSQSATALIPNLEIMKLATYYRNEENVFCRLIGLEETELNAYEKVYFFSEAEEMPKVPPAFLKAENVIFGGTAFTNGSYIPFKNKIIDYVIPRPAIYKDFLKKKYQDGIKTSVIGHILDDSYYRNYAGEAKLPIPPIKLKKRVYLYDKEFFYPDWQDTIQDIVKRKPSSIVRIHPIVCKTITQYFQLREEPKIARTSEIILDTNIPLSEVGYMLKTYKNLFLADITYTSSIYLPLGGNLPSGYHYYNDLIYKLNLLYSFWSAGIDIKVKYINPSIGVNNPLKNLDILVAKWASGRQAKLTKSINERIPNKKRKSDDDPPPEAEKKLLLKFHPEAKDLFDQSFEPLKKRGYWRV